MVKVTDQIDIMNENNHETAHGLHAKKEIDHPDIANEQFPETARGLRTKKVIDHPDIANEQFPETAHGLRAKKEIDHFDITNELNQFPETKRETARGLGAKKEIDHPDITNEQFPETARGLRAKKEIDHPDITNELNQFPETERETVHGLHAKEIEQFPLHIKNHSSLTGKINHISLQIRKKHNHHLQVKNHGKLRG